MNLIGLRMFPLSLAGEAATRFIELPYNSIHTWDQLRDVFLATQYPVSKKLNQKGKVNTIVALLGQSGSSSTSFVRGFPKHRVHNESLKEYFDRGKDYNSKAVLDTIADGSYGECTYYKIAEKLENISLNNKLEALESQTLRETPLQYKLQTTQQQMRFVKSWHK